MKPLVPFRLVALVVVPTLACGDGNASAGDAGGVDSQNAAFGSSAGPPTYLTLTGPAKRFCSAIWVS